MDDDLEGEMVADVLVDRAEIEDWARVIVRLGTAAAVGVAQKHDQRHHDNILAARDLILELLRIDEAENAQ